MKGIILQLVKQFLGAHYRGRGPLLLGFSGGPDSLALLHLLNDCMKFFPFQLHVAHVDHNWRQESEREALQLAQYVEKLGLPFHGHVLQKGTATSEEAGRRARLDFFNNLYQELKCEALILGHHADDQAETVLKRILEGASWGALSGIQPIVSHQGMQIWRPLLTISKKTIREWIANRGLTPIEDPTNYDVKYLRSRMRVRIVPDLEAHFGKAVASNLVRLGTFAKEVKEYLQRKSPLFSMERKRSQEGISLDFNPYFPLDSFELNLFLKHVFNEEGISLSFRSISVIQSLIERRIKNKIVDSIIIDNGTLLIVKNN